MIFDKSSLIVTLFLAIFDMAERAQAAPQPAGLIGDILAGSFNDGITVTANDVVQCGYANISWTGASPPVTVEIGQGGYYIGTTSIANITVGWDNHTEWLVTQQEGVDLIFQVVDALGKTGYVQNVKVGAGDSNCLENSTSNSSLTASSGSTGSATATASSTAVSEAVGGTSETASVISISTSTDASDSVSPSPSAEITESNEVSATSAITSQIQAPAAASSTSPTASAASSSAVSSTSQTSSTSSIPSFSPTASSSPTTSSDGNSASLAAANNDSTASGSSSSTSSSGAFPGMFVSGASVIFAAVGTFAIL
ncbi:hypothetical protein CNBG_1576 [Cryptococcus deuterogattii R265]|uniref:Uncharacterized protein n=1 Tax=Cryptococcus deuterogattii (strain R265) TaxID=294750 RepID=A0A095EE77_CRYD2|nr:hypothetical protein CNBG_1576 [Cryptococcus deuterogattii R265]KIR28898.1 hypothetical protein I309_02393 [Cryptococcus deuterogattii LA55]KIR32749.1 hypothetical protein I352_04684 [Cryptococcus deuterogattii MMRL2647]KIR71077.1 hypothetical protein I310_04968 [Cryptococcus deuterogattii CA1014]KIR94743.1 hypothetical protein I304_01062 [Cryptococcus deuterogattii CBS 10090]KIS00732.1 hypothetical protein L804_02153 [Cryptococcus deuterogattii 2001/935-1]